MIGYQSKFIFMKHKTFIWSLLVLSALQFANCKSKEDNSATTTTTTVDTTVTMAPPPAPVEIAADTALETGLRDATKEFPDVKATTEDGEVTLTGNIERDQLPTLMQSINSLHPKKINNNLTIK